MSIKQIYVFLILFIAEALYAEEINFSAMVNAHNTWRSEVGVIDIRWSDELKKKAQIWATQLKAKNCLMEHSGSGENLYWASPKQFANTKDSQGNWIWQNSLQIVDEKEVIAAWASEKQWYNYATNTCNAPPDESCGHYTQVVWKDSLEVGCAKAICDDFSQVWVCNYAPAGNVVGQKPY